jgi:hypothetical protein
MSLSDIEKIQEACVNLSEDYQITQTSSGGSTFKR